MRHPTQILNVLVSLLLLSLASCTTHTRGPLLDEDLTPAAQKVFTTYLDSVSQTCSVGYDGNGSIRWEYALGNFAFPGYFKIGQPSSVFFSALNPFGQPFYAVATDGETFSTVDTRTKTHLSGSVRSYALRNGIPMDFLTGNWASWLLGSPSVKDPVILAIREDTEGNGYWFTLALPPSDKIAAEHLLIDPLSGKLLQRSILDIKEKPMAMFRYENWQENNGCMIPEKIVIDGLSFGTKATIELNDIESANFIDGDFRLHAPVGYRRLVMP
ncbi:MAG: DUF4292 domain-containing protein [Desulfobulbaceae bacterium]|nr:MAG: DUF4292 domain-containing protein [Desulfobulbaceae bacterium]